jgi:hypothetical protein
MKKFFTMMLAAATMVSYSTSEVEYENPKEIGFTAVANNISRTVVDGTVYPTSLDMYVYAWTADNAATDANYIINGKFKNKEGNVWGGETPYYWPNVKTLHFAGYSASGNVSSATVAYNCKTDVLSITGYAPGTSTDAGANDLMYFPSTKATNPAGYDKETTSVPVNMYHTCSWITFKVKGDAVTGANGSTYQVTDLQITGIDQTANVTCGALDNGVPNITWSENTTQTEAYPVTLSTSLGKLTTTATNVEASNNLVLIPQTPGKLTLTYSYTSPAGQTITETKENIALKLDEANSQWEPGKHYIYTITIKANEILIAPSAVDWADQNDKDITVE